MTEEQYKKIYEMTDKDARARAIDALPPKEYMEYMEYADRIRARQKEQNEAKAAAPAAETMASAPAVEKKKKKISGIANKLIICLCVYLTISIAHITLGYVVNKAEIHASVKKEFERDACVCGIRIDGKWFKTADEAAEYLIDTHMKLEWYVVFDWNWEPYEYYTHIIKTM